MGQVEAVGTRDGGVLLRDRETGDEFVFSADVVVNASGPWTDLTNAAFGGETISARWPLPTGITRSMTRVVRMCGSVSRRSRSCGYSGVSL